jgi:hypothetical protein
VVRQACSQVVRSHLSAVRFHAKTVCLRPFFGRSQVLRQIFVAADSVCQMCSRCPDGRSALRAGNAPDPAHQERCEGPFSRWAGFWAHLACRWEQALVSSGVALELGL